MKKGCVGKKEKKFKNVLLKISTKKKKKNKKREKIKIKGYYSEVNEKNVQ